MNLKILLLIQSMPVIATDIPWRMFNFKPFDDAKIGLFLNTFNNLAIKYPFKSFVSKFCEKYKPFSA